MRSIQRKKGLSSGACPDSLGCRSTHGLNDTKSFIEDQQSMTMIGLDEKFEGFYYLILRDKYEDASSINNSFVCSLSNIVLFHFKLGHLSPSRMQFLHTIFPLLSLIERLYVMYVILLHTKNFLLTAILINPNIHLILFILIFEVPSN